MSIRKPLLAILTLVALAIPVLMGPAGAQADFGIESFSVGAFEEGGAVDLRAGSHPYEFKVELAMNLDSEERPEGTLSEVVVDLPAGMVGNPLAVPRCPTADFEGVLAHCPGNTQVGFVRLDLAQFEGYQAFGPVYNLTPPKGVAASIGFTAANENSFQEASLRTGSDYGVRVSDITVPTGVKVQHITETIWGVPTEAGHDAERTCIGADGKFIRGCRNELDPKPFLTLPTSCAGPLKTTVTISSVQEPGVPVSKTVESLGEGGEPEGLHACDRPPFAPAIEAQPETTSPDSPTGLHVNLHIPQNEDPEGIATAHLKDTVLTLPAGLAVNPSSADGLGACSSSQIDLKGPGPANCPASSKLGTVAVHTPLLDHPVTGALYIATQGDNPFNSLLALYIAVNDPITGVVVKLAGKVEPDPLSGQLKATFKDNPQLPFEDFEVDFPGGPRAALTTPATCGKYTTASTLVPWSAPEGPTTHPTDSFSVSGSCVGSEAQMPNNPSFEAGTTSPLAGSYSPFVLRLARDNGSQRFKGLSLNLPAGLTAKLAGVGQCSDAQLAQAASRSNPGEGIIEKQSPSCPSESHVGIVNVGAGSGTPFYVQGDAYLAGPYKGAPVSLAIVTPAVAGPFDLGTVVVRSALYIDPNTAQVTVKSDEIPQILQGIPLDVRTIAIQVDRSNFTLNPTSCEAMAIDGALTSNQGGSAALSNRFQASGCRGLGFKPRFSIRLKGGTKRASNPKLITTLSPRQGDANISSLSVKLPPSAFLDQSHIRTVCTRVQFAADACPPGSIYGKVSVQTPILGYPLTGNVYLRSSNHKLPDLVPDLRGPASQPIRIQLSGRTDSVAGALRSSFEFIPDAPFSSARLELFGGKRGLVVNSRNLCAHTYRATATYEAHNGASYEARPAVQDECGGKRKGKRKR